MKVLADLVFVGKKVFLRADLDVNVEQLTVNPLREASGSRFTEATRLENLKPTVEYLIEHGARQIFIAGHIGRPAEPDPELSTANLEAPLEMLLGRSVTYKRDFNLDDGMLSSMAQIILFENLRFWPQEEKNDLGFAKQLARLADIYVNDAFATCHRVHASIVALPQLFSDVEDLLESERPRSRRPEGHRPRRAAGLHLAREVEVLEGLLTAPKRPFVVVIGGAKIETKAPVVENLAKIADWVLVGGEIAKELTVDPLREASSSQFTADRNYSSSDQREVTLKTSNISRGKFSLRSNNNPKMSNVMVATLTSDGKDIDQASVDKFNSVIKTAKTIVWNGPMGFFEQGFEAGSVAVAQAIIDSGAYSVVGGGETTQFLALRNLLFKFSFVSSGGGALLEFLAGKELPGIVALE